MRFAVRMVVIAICVIGTCCFGLYITGMDHNHERLRQGKELTSGVKIVHDLTDLRPKRHSNNLRWQLSQHNSTSEEIASRRVRQTGIVPSNDLKYPADHHNAGNEGHNVHIVPSNDESPAHVWHNAKSNSAASSMEKAENYPNADPSNKEVVASINLHTAKSTNFAPASRSNDTAITPEDVPTNKTRKTIPPSVTPTVCGKNEGWSRYSLLIWIPCVIMMILFVSYVLIRWLRGQCKSNEPNTRKENGGEIIELYDIGNGPREVPTHHYPIKTCYG